MEVVLQEDYPSLGYVGDHVKVKSGYARNYLIPRGIALEVSSRNAKQLEHRLVGVASRKSHLKSLAEERASELRSMSLQFTLKIGEQGKSFGSVSARDIQVALEEKGQTVDRKQIRLGEPIKSGGNFEVEIKLHSEVVALVQIQVEAEVSALKPSGKRREKKEGAEAVDVDGKEVSFEEALAQEDARDAIHEDEVVDEALEEIDNSEEYEE